MFMRKVSFHVCFRVDVFVCKLWLWCLLVHDIMSVSMSFDELLAVCLFMTL